MIKVWEENRSQIRLFIFIFSVQPISTTKPRNSKLKQAPPKNLSPSHDWYQTQKHVVISVYTKRRGNMMSFVLHLIYIWYKIIIGYVNLYICFRFIDPHYFESMFDSNNIVVYVYGATEDTDHDSSIGNQCLKIIIRFPPESGY